MKTKIILLLLLVSVILVSGCTQESKPTITTLKVEPSFADAGQSTTIIYTIDNPIKYNFDGFVFLQADNPDCFSLSNVEVGGQYLRGIKRDISILAFNQTSGIINVQVIGYLNQGCYNTHKLTLFLIQNSRTFDSKTVDFLIVKR